MQENREYLTEEELEKFITQVEAEPLYQAPDYLEQMILQKAKRLEVKESVEIVPIRHAFKEGKPPVLSASKGRQLLAYSLKIAAAAAAAIALLVTVPGMEEQSADAYQQQVVQEQKEHEETQSKVREKKSVTRSLNEKTSDFCSLLFEKTNEILFQREEK